MNKLKCYYAHPMLTYDSTIEEEDLIDLEEMGFDVMNPNNPVWQIECQEYAISHGKDQVMDYFTAKVEKCNVLAFRALPSGEILSGVAKEIQAALNSSIPVIELPRRLESRMMDYPQTKEYLTEIGYRKIR